MLKKKEQKSQVILSPKDKRDYVVGSKIDLSGDYPLSFAVWQPPVENQGDTGNCVAQTLANIYETWRHREGDEHEDYSVGYIYGTAQGYGMIPREACGAVCDEGDVLRRVWECYDENPKCHNQRKVLPPTITATATKMAEYVQINSLNEAKAFLIKYELPIMMICEGKAYSPFAGGYHATAVYGWNEKDELLYTNSWGVGGCYGDGKGKMPYGKVKELWGVIPMESKKGFTDISGHWAEKAIIEMADKGIINGYPDGTFQPNKPVTRAEVAAMLNRFYNVIEGLVHYARN